MIMAQDHDSTMLGGPNNVDMAFHSSLIITDGDGPSMWESVATMEEAMAVIANLENELSRTRSMAQSQVVARDKAQDELDNLRQVAEDVNEENDMIVNDMQELYRENDKLHETLKMKRETQAELEKQIEKVHAECEELQDRIEACQSQAVDPGEVHEAVQQIRSSGNLKLKEAAKERQCMEEMVESMKGELNDTRAKMLQLVTEKDNMIRKYKSIQRRMKRCNCQGQKTIHDVCSKNVQSDEEGDAHKRSFFRKHLHGGTAENSHNPPNLVAIDDGKKPQKDTLKRHSKTKRFASIFSDQSEGSEPETSAQTATDPSPLKKENSIKNIVERAVGRSGKIS